MCHSLEVPRNIPPGNWRNSRHSVFDKWRQNLLAHCRSRKKYGFLFLEDSKKNRLQLQGQGDFFAVSFYKCGFTANLRHSLRWLYAEHGVLLPDSSCSCVWSLCLQDTANQISCEEILEAQTVAASDLMTAPLMEARYCCVCSALLIRGMFGMRIE